MSPLETAFDLQQFLSSCFEGSYWRAWMLSRDSDRVIEAGSIGEPSPEEKMMVRKLTNFTDFAELPSDHALLSKPVAIVLNVFHFDWGRVVLASEIQSAPIVRIVASLLPDLLEKARLRSRLKHLVEQNNKKLEQFRAAESTKNNALIKFVEFIMSSWKEKQSGTISFADDLSLRFIDSGPDEITVQLKEALEIKRFLNPSGPFHITADDIQPVPESKPVYTIVSGSQRAEILLTKYEEAAERAFRNGESVNGKTVAAYLQPSVSPPAVTDALKKHKREIAGLVHQYPERWKLVRQFVKPVRDLADRSFFE